MKTLVAENEGLAKAWAELPAGEMIFLRLPIWPAVDPPPTFEDVQQPAVVVLHEQPLIRIPRPDVVRFWRFAGDATSCTGLVPVPYMPGDLVGIREFCSISEPYTDVLPDTRTIYYLADGVQHEGRPLTPPLDMPLWAIRTWLRCHECVATRHWGAWTWSLALEKIEKRGLPDLQPHNFVRATDQTAVTLLSLNALPLQSDRPSAVYRPGLSIDGDKWRALYGANLQDGVAGFGDSPAEAMRDFDRAWTASLGGG